MIETKKQKILFYLSLTAFPIIVALWCLGSGRFGLSHFHSLSVLYHVIIDGKDSVSATEYSIIMNMRLPRILLALVCGGGLAVSGVGLQSTFSNPLVSPDTLGVASGASFGAAFALLFQVDLILVQCSALFFGLLACFLTYMLSSVGGNRKIIMLILSGIVVSSLFQSLVSLVKYVADTDEILPSITYWLMGSLYTANYSNLYIGCPPILLCLILLFFIRWKMNVLCLPEEEAKSLGISIYKMRLFVIICSATITACVVSMSGQIGWIGLLIPHICRLLFGHNHKKVVPASIFLGATFLVVIDTISRSIAVTEVPVSILTSIIGAPIFLFLLRKAGHTL